MGSLQEALLFSSSLAVAKAQLWTQTLDLSLWGSILLKLGEGGQRRLQNLKSVESRTALPLTFPNAGAES